MYHGFYEFQNDIKAQKEKYYNTQNDLIEKPVKKCTLEDINFDESGQLLIEVNSIPFNCLYSRDDSKRLYVILSGGIGEGTRIPNFQRGNYYSILDGCVLAVDDPMYSIYKDKGLKVGWYYGKEKTLLDDFALIIEKLCCDIGIDQKDIVFYGSSSGGYAAL